MSGINVIVESDFYQCNLHFGHRLSFVRGDSGRGKTTLAEIALNSPELIDSTLPIVVVNETTWQAVLQQETDKIVIFDDIDVIQSGKFTQLVSQHVASRNLWLIIFNRENLMTNTNNVENGNQGINRSLSIASDAIYGFHTNGIHHWLESWYDFEEPELSKVTHVICEDSGFIFKYIKEMLSNLNVATAKGKANILKEITEEKKYCLVLADMSALGCHLDDFFDNCDRINTTVFFCEKLISMEELLLQSNLYNKLPTVRVILDNIEEFANEELSWETYFKKKLNECTRCTFNHLTHNSKDIGKCFIINCSECNEHIEAKCNHKLEGNKFTALFEETKYACLLELRGSPQESTSTLKKSSAF